MTDNGFVLAYRRSWHHPIFRDLLDAAIWNYLCQNAAWCDRREVVNGTRVSLKRGQIFVSYRKLAEGFCCAEARIRRLTEALTDDAMAIVQATHRGTLITICNYDEYQPLQGTGDALSAAQPTRRRKKVDALYKDNKTKEENETNNTEPPLELPNWLDGSTWIAFKEMRKGLRFPLTEKAQELMFAKLEKLRSQGHDPTQVLEQSIRNSWRDVFELKGDNYANPRKQNPKPSNTTESLSALREAGNRIMERRRMESAKSEGTFDFS